MDPQLSPILIAVISAGSVLAGSFLTFIGAIINQFITSRKEQKQWENQQQAEKAVWERGEQKKEKEYLRDVYQNSLQSLSALLTLSNNELDESNAQDKLEQINEVQKWI